MVGERIREARQAQRLSLTAVAKKVRISAATLSRIENGKQPLGVDLLVTLARTLKVSPEDLLGENGRTAAVREGDLVAKIASLPAPKRARLWRELAAARRRERAETFDLHHRIDEMLAQIDFLREEIEIIRSGLRRQRAPIPGDLDAGEDSSLFWDRSSNPNHAPRANRRGRRADSEPRGSRSQARAHPVGRGRQRPRST